MVFEPSKVDFNIVRRRLKQNTGAADAEKYKFYGQHFPQLDEFIFKRYFPDINIQGVFVECGANNGQAGSNCKFFEETMHWTGYNIEASPTTFQLLKKNRPNSVNICAALSNKRGEVEFAKTKPVGENPKYLGAVDRVVADAIMEEGDIFTVSGLQYRVDQIISVPCLPWCEFVEKYDIQRVDLFILDTEGHEGFVLEGMKECAVLPSVICVEDGWRADVRCKLEALGYVFDIAHFGNHMFLRKDLLGLFALRSNHKNF